MPFSEALEKAHVAINQATKLHEDLGGNAFQFNGILWQRGQIRLRLDLDYQGALEDLKSVSAFGPRNLWPYYWYSTIALREGRRQDAVRDLEQAAKLHAGFQQPIFHAAESLYLNMLGDPERALATASRGLILSRKGGERGTLLRTQARSLILLDRQAEAAASLEEGWNIDGRTNPANYMALFYDNGQTERAQELLQSVKMHPMNAGRFAEIYARMGNLDAAFEALEMAVLDRDYQILDAIRVADWLDPLRADPRFNDLLDLVDSLSTYTDAYHAMQDGAAGGVRYLKPSTGSCPCGRWRLDEYAAVECRPVFIVAPLSSNLPHFPHLCIARMTSPHGPTHGSV